MIASLYAAIAAFGVACLVAHVLAKPSARWRILDHPNERSLHSTPVPRTGGLAIWAGGVAGTAIAVVVLGTRVDLIWIGGAALLVGMVSFVDDRFALPVSARLTTHLAAAALLLVGGLRLDSIGLPGMEILLPQAIAWPLGILFITWMTNLYNFMDGMDGLAGGMTCIGFGTLALLGGLTDHLLFASLSLIVAAAAAGFLVFNFPLARIFMGDTGSSTIGFLAAAFILWAARVEMFPLWVGILIFSPFIVDASVTLVRRLIRRDKIWLAHKTHYYQRLVQAGWGHRKTALAEYALMALCAVSALISLYLPVAWQWIVIGAWIVCYVQLVVWVGRIERQTAGSRGVTQLENKYNEGMTRK